MFWHIFVYRLKELLRDPWHIAWNLLFPIALATAFFLGFGNMIKEDPEVFVSIKTGYIAMEDKEFEKVLQALSRKGEDQVLSLQQYETEKEAEKALRAGKIEGYYLQKGGEIVVVVGKNGISATTLNQIVKEYKNQKTVMLQIAKEHPEKVAEIAERMNHRPEFLQQHVFNQYTSPYMNYFYSLIAMAALYGSWLSSTMLAGISANMTERGKRFESAPVKKMTSLLAGILSTMLLQTVFIGILVLYIEFVLKISFGVPLWQVLIVTSVGGVMGIMMGVFIGALVKRPSLQMVISLSVSMVASFLSGLMWGQIRQILEVNAPVVNRLNPAAMLTSCLYNLCNYGMTKDFYRDLYSMLVLIVAMLVISAAVLRRRNYDSL